MSNPLLPYVNPVQSLATYGRIKDQLGQDNLIFEAMRRVATKRGFSFSLPSELAEVEDKHHEIEQSLKREVMLARRGLFFDLMEELHSQLLVADKQVMAERLRLLIDLRFQDDFSIKLNLEGAWIIQWELTVDNESGSYENVVSLVVYRQDKNQIVPWHVVEYINSGIVLFRRKAYATALALMTVAVEATLRDALATRGYGAGQRKKIWGLSQALSIARDEERLITAADLPPDLDDVLKAIRNNLLHLSAESFNAKLPRYNSISTIGSYTLADFIRDKELVSTFVIDIPRFVNDQYVKLWKSEGQIQAE